MNKALKNIFSSSLPQGINIISSLILPTLIITIYGSEINGLISTTRAILGYIALVGAGISAAVTQSLYEPVAKKDVPVVKGMLHAADNMFNRYGRIYVLITLAVSLIYPFFIKNINSYATVSLLLIVMSISGASEFFIVGYCRTLLYANQKVYVNSIIQAVSLSVSLLLAILLLKLEVNIIIVQLGISATYICRSILLNIYVHRTYPQYQGFRSVPPIARTVQKRKNALIHHLSGLMTLGTQSMILTFFIGLNAASIYAVYNIVFAGLTSICAQLNNAVIPFFGKEFALNNNKKLNVMYGIWELCFFHLVTFVYCVTMIMIVPFVALYTKKADINYIYPVFAATFVYASSFYILKIPSNSVINAAGHFKETQGRAMIEASLSFILGIICTKLFGLIGVLIGMAIALGWRCIDTVYYTNKHILKRKHLKSFLRLGFVYLSLTICCIVSFKSNYFCANYLEWIVQSCKISFCVLVCLGIESVLFEHKTLMQIVRYLKHRKFE